MRIRTDKRASDSRFAKVSPSGRRADFPFLIRRIEANFRAVLTRPFSRRRFNSTLEHRAAAPLKVGQTLRMVRRYKRDHRSG